MNQLKPSAPTCLFTPLLISIREVRPNTQDRAKTEFESAYGLIRTEWFYENGKFTYKVTIPDEAEAKVSQSIFLHSMKLKIWLIVRTFNRPFHHEKHSNRSAFLLQFLKTNLTELS